MRLADTLPATLSESGPNLVATARTRLDPAWITEALEAAGVMNVRRRKLPFDVVVWLIIGANLMAGYAFDQVVRHLGLTPRTRRSTAQAPPSSGAVADARARLGDDAMREVFRVTSAHWSADVRFDDRRFHGLRVLAADGFALRTTDTASNAAEFGKPGSRRGEAAYPVVRAVGVIETGTHIAIDLELGGANTSELALIEALIERLPSDTVTILDRNYDSVRHLHLLGDDCQQRHWLVRSKGRAKAKVAVALGVGDDLVDVEVGREVRRRHPDMPASMRMRRIRYTAGRTEVTVLTSMTDATRFPADEVAALYHERWEIEMAFDDMKTEQRDSALTLRSKTPVGVRQEIYGLLVAHNLVRVEMAHAANEIGVPPTRISFHRALLVVCDHIRATAESSPPTKWADHIVLMRSRLQYLVNPERRSDRHYPREMKMPVGRYARKLPTPR
jgi:Transposase DDE domain/Insertion element 4 transposase N-terminal